MGNSGNPYTFILPVKRRPISRFRSHRTRGATAAEPLIINIYVMMQPVIYPPGLQSATNTTQTKILS